MKYLIKLFIIFFLIILCWNCESPTDSNNIPSCSITYPPNQKEFIKGEKVKIEINAEDEDGKVEEVRLYFGDKGLANLSKFPYKYSINTTNFNDGRHIIKAVAYDDKNDKKADSITIYITSANEYDGLKTSLYHDKFIEDFINNNNYWPEGSAEGVSYTIGDGTYTITNSTTSDILISGQKISINTDDNFEIETKIKMHDNNSMGGLFWGLKNTQETTIYKAFEIGPDAGYMIYYFDGESENRWFDWTYSDSTNNSGDYNKITVRKYNNNYYFFINENYIGKHKFSSFDGANIGFLFYPSSILIVDYFYVYVIDHHVGNNINKVAENKPANQNSPINLRIDKDR